MDFEKYKITDEEVSAADVRGCDNPLGGTEEENKAIFDNYPDLIREKFDDFVGFMSDRYGNIGEVTDLEKFNEGDGLYLVTFEGKKSLMLVSSGAKVIISADGSVYEYSSEEKKFNLVSSLKTSDYTDEEQKKVAKNTADIEQLKSDVDDIEVELGDKVDKEEIIVFKTKEIESGYIEEEIIPAGTVVKIKSTELEPNGVYTCVYMDDGAPNNNVGNIPFKVNNEGVGECLFVLENDTLGEFIMRLANDEGEATETFVLEYGQYIPDVVEKHDVQIRDINMILYNILKEGTDFETDGNGVITRMLKNNYEGQIIAFPEGTTSINLKDSGGFYGQPLAAKKVIFPSTLKGVESCSFSNSASTEEAGGNNIQVTEFVLNEGFSAIASTTLFKYNRTLETVNIPSNWKRIYENFCCECTNLKKVVIPTTIIEIREGAFADCPNLTIYGYAGSVAETYAKENEIPFVNIGSDYTKEISAINEELEKKGTSGVYVLQEGTDFETDGKGVITQMLKNDYEGQIITFPKDITEVTIQLFGVMYEKIFPFVCKKIILPDNVIKFTGYDIKGEIDTGSVEEFYLFSDIYRCQDENAVVTDLAFNRNITNISFHYEYAPHAKIWFKETPLNSVSITGTIMTGETESVVIDVRNVDNFSQLNLQSLNGPGGGMYKILGNAGTYAEEYAKENDISFVNVGSNFTPQILANTLKGKVSGTAFNLDDISPVEERLKVTVSGVEDFSNVTLYKTGKNLFDIVNAPMFGNNNSTNPDEIWGFQRTNTGLKMTFYTEQELSSKRIGYQCIPISILKGNTISFSCRRIFSGISDTSSTCIIIYAADNELTQDYTYIGGKLTNSIVYKELNLKNAVNGYFNHTFTIPKDETRKNLFVIFYPLSNGTALENSYVEYSDIQIEINNTATEYEPYKTPIACDLGFFNDGRVLDYDDVEPGREKAGVKPIYPNTTLYTDTEGAIITCEYNRDITRVIADIEKAIISLGGNV